LTMDNQISAGDTCTITREISVGGRLAFQEGEWVRVESVDPDPQRPEHRYIVMSQFLNSRLKLTDADLAVRSHAQPAPPTPEAAPLPQMEAPGAAFPPPMGAHGAGGIKSPEDRGFRSSQAFLPVVIIVAIVIAVAAFAAVYFITRGGEEVPVEAGWKTFEGEGVQISLPDNYEGGSADEVEEIVKKMKSLGSEYEAMAEMMNANPDMFVLWVYDPEISTGGLVSNVIVLEEPIPSGISLESYVEAASDMLPPEMQVVEQGIVSLDKYEAARLVMDTTMMGATIKQVVYAIKDGSTMYTITFSTSLSEFNERLPDFEKSVNTFRY